MEKELQDAFRKLAKRDVDTFVATVVSVNKTKGTCTVNDEQIDYFDVKLQSVSGTGNKGLILFPKVESSVLVSPINEDLHHLYIEAFSELESFEMVVEGCKMQIDKDGFLLKKENETLKSLMLDLLQAIKQMSFIVTTPVGPGATSVLNNTAVFTLIENRFKTFLKDN